MKVFRFNNGRIGIERDGEARDVTAALNFDPAEWPPVRILRLIAGTPAEIRKAFDHRDSHEIRLGGADVHLEVPIEWPNKLLAFPANYVLHQKEMNSTNQADINGFFLKANSSLSGPNDPVVLPNRPDREFHHESEVGLVIGRSGRNIPRERALEYVFGYACLLDMTMRGKEERVFRKSYDTFCPFGPWITTADEVPEPGNLQMRLWVNDELRQDANTRDLILDIPGMIQLASSAATLLPGDIIATGTPAGVGPVKQGDRIRIAIDHLGEMTVPVQVQPASRT